MLWGVLQFCPCLEGTCATKHSTLFQIVQLFTVNWCHLFCFGSYYIRWQLKILAANAHQRGSCYFATSSSPLVFLTSWPQEQTFSLCQCAPCNTAVLKPDRRWLLTVLFLLFTYLDLHLKVTPASAFPSFSFSAATWKCSGHIAIEVVNVCACWNNCYPACYLLFFVHFLLVSVCN